MISDNYRSSPFANCQLQTYYITEPIMNKLDIDNLIANIYKQNHKKLCLFSFKTKKELNNFLKINDNTYPIKLIIKNMCLIQIIKTIL